MTSRIAVVQHGDAREARRLRANDAPEPYYGMHYSQGFLDSWMASRPHLVVSLNAPEYREQCGEGLFVGLPEPSGFGRIPGTLRQLYWSRQIVSELQRFRPHPFLLRTGYCSPPCCCERLAYHWRTLAMFAGFFPNTRRYDRIITSQIIRSLNHPLVFAAGTIGSQRLIPCSKQG